MSIFRCKMCGGDLEIIENASSCTCDFCGTQQTIPTIKDENLQGLFNRANVLRMKSEFDKAEEIYEKILQSSSTEAEAYWGLILCKYGIEYVEDPATFKRVPTCHRASYESIAADEDYKSALRYADVQQKLIYEAEAKEIEEVQKGIMALVAKEEPYDVFICYKETDESGKRTQDSVIANDIYYQLTQEGFKVFYAAITLEDKLGTEYEPYIFSALNTARVMLSLGTKPEYFNAVWVKNEWSRFLKIMKKDRSKMLIPCYRDMDPYELPEEFAHLQAQDMSKIGFINDIVRGIKKVVVKDEGNAAGETVVIQQTSAISSNAQALLDRGSMALEDSEWEKADGFYEEVLNQDAKCAEAYLGKLLAREHRSNFESYIRSQCSKYETADSKRLEACPENTTAKDESVKKYVIVNYLSEGDITALFPYGRTYLSQLEARTQQKDRQLGELSSDKLLNRIKQYMSGEFADMINAGLARIEAALDNRIKEAKDTDDMSIAQITAAYKAHITEAEKKAKEMYDVACGKREDDYQAYLAKLEKAQTRSDYVWLKDDFDKLGDYKESQKKSQYCEQENARLKEEEQLAATKKKAKETRDKVIVAAAVVGIILAIIVIIKVIIPENRYNAAQKALGEGRYEEAIAGFTELGDYKDAAEMVVQSKAVAMKNGVSGISGIQVSYADKKWLVLDTKEGKALLLSKNVICEKEYNEKMIDITWKECTLRKWLNNEYINEAFSEEERKAIVGTRRGNNTKDKIFLLSIDEVNKYFASNEERKALTAAGESARWWLRSPGDSSLLAAFVYDDGSVYEDGHFVDNDYGVRPAFWIDASNL